MVVHSRLRTVGVLLASSVVASLSPRPCAAQSVAREGLYFHAAFENSRMAIVAGRETKPLNEGKYEYEPGPVGQAIVIGEDAVIYREEDGFPLKKGTVGYWLKPHWEPVAGKGHWPFKKWVKWDRRPVDGLWFLFGSFGGGPHLDVGLSGSKGAGSTLFWFYARETDTPEWKQGEWKHVAVTWGNEGSRFYINGCLVDAGDTKVGPDKHAEKFYLGGKHNYYSGKISMDDLRVYVRPLSGTEIKALADMGSRELTTARPRRGGLLAELTVNREFSRIFKELYEKGKGRAESAIGLSVAMNREFEAYCQRLPTEDRELVRALRRRFALALRNICAIPRARSAPKCDGQVTKEEWRETVQLKGFRLYKSAQHVWLDTTVYLCYDEQCLYLAAICCEEEGEKVIATFTERDDKIWRDDAVELLVQSHPGEDQYRQFIVNANGACFDAYAGDVKWDSDLKVGATSVGRAGQWSVEMAIPLKDLGLGPAKGMLFRGNISRDNVGGKTVNEKGGYTLEISTWAPVTTRLNDLGSFGVFVLE